MVTVVVAEKNSPIRALWWLAVVEAEKKLTNERALMVTVVVAEKNSPMRALWWLAVVEAEKKLTNESALMASRGCGCGLDTGLVEVPASCSLRTVEDSAALEAEVYEDAGHRGGVEQRV